MELRLTVVKKLLNVTSFSICCKLFKLKMRKYYYKIIKVENKKILEVEFTSLISLCKFKALKYN